MKYMQIVHGDILLQRYINESKSKENPMKTKPITGNIKIERLDEVECKTDFINTKENFLPLYQFDFSSTFLEFSCIKYHLLNRSDK